MHLQNKTREIILNVKGEKIGQHKGLAYYTIGQRKGLGLSLGTPYMS